LPANGHNIGFGCHKSQLKSDPDTLMDIEEQALIFGLSTHGQR
jgi:hypothetical protein